MPKEGDVKGVRKPQNRTEKIMPLDNVLYVDRMGNYIVACMHECILFIRLPTPHPTAFAVMSRGLYFRSRARRSFEEIERLWTDV